MTTPDNDDERTVIKGAPAGPHGAPRAGLPGEYADALPAGTRLHEFEILSVIGQGGFGIVYLAHDLTLDRRVAIKEYMPSALATRTQAMTVAVRSSRHTETFAAGLRSFINEARLLAQFDHPSLLKVHRFWEAHGTAYMVMPYYAGITLGQLLLQPGGPPDEARLLALLHPLIDALELLHAARCYHRDIAPDNILMLPDGRPLLLDFGAARRVIGDMTQALTVILKTGYAPVEQYGGLPDMPQGAWTDIYALGSVLQFAITGHTPPQAVARFLKDRREPLAVTAAGRYSEQFLSAIDRSLAVLPKDRPQSVAELRALIGHGPRNTPVPGANEMPTATMPSVSPSPTLFERARDSLWRDERNSATVQRTAPPSVDTVSQATLALQTQTRQAPQTAGTTPRPGTRTIALGVAALLLALLALAAATGGFAWLGAQRHQVADPAAAAPKISAPAPTLEPAAPAAPEPPAPEAAAPALPARPEANVQPELNAEPVAPAHTPAPTADARPTAAMSRPSPSPSTSPRAIRPPAPVPAPEAGTALRTPNKKLSNERCADIIQRVSLGEEPSADEKTFLKQECGK